MENQVKVAVVRDSRRRAAVAQALALVADDIRDRISPRVLLKPNIVSHERQPASTHVDAFSATLDALFAAGAREVVVAEGASDASAAFDRFGLRREASGRPVRFLDLNRDETDWIPLELIDSDGIATREARVSRTVVEADCRVSLALAKTHVTTGVTLGIKNMLSSVHPDDRVMMHGSARGGNGYSGWRKLVVNWLKGDSLAVNSATRTMGRVRNVLAFLSRKHGPNGWNKLSKRDLAFLRSVAAMHRNLVALSSLVKPNLTVIDAHKAMHGEGPRHGTPIRLNVAIAGTDAVAVDSVAANLLGFAPRSIGFLVLAERAGLGVADLDAIAIVGDALNDVRKACRPHSNHHVQRHWDRLILPNNAVVPAPHASLRREGFAVGPPNLDRQEHRHEIHRT